MQAPLQSKIDTDSVQMDTVSTARQEQPVVDNRQEAVVQHKLVELMNNSPRVLQQRAVSDAIHNSPRMMPQRREVNAHSGGAVVPQGYGAIPAGASPTQREERPNNTGLPNRLKSGIESLSGMSMDNVKVHYNSDKPAQLQAHAFAQGREIHVAAGKERHLPHEAWHIVQQAQGRVKATIHTENNVGANNDDTLENEATQMGSRAETALENQDIRPSKISPQNLVIQKASWEESDGIFRWDEIIDGVFWFQNSAGERWFKIADAEAIKLGQRHDYEKLEGQKKTFLEWNEISVKPISAESMKPVGSASLHPSFKNVKASVVNHPLADAIPNAEQDVPDEASRIINKFSEGGILMKTVTQTNAYKDFQDAGASVSDIPKLREAKRYGAKRNWSLMHHDIIAAPFGMVSTGSELAKHNTLIEETKNNKQDAAVTEQKLKALRSIAFLADPDEIGSDRFIGIHEKDKASNSHVQDDVKPLSKEEVDAQMKKLRDDLVAKQKGASGRLDNSEIQTLGFNSGAIFGLLFKPGSFATWDAAKPNFQILVNTIASPSSLVGYTPSTRSNFLIFTFTVDEAAKTTDLVYLDTLYPKKSADAAARA
jgi:hypothetical protein